MSEMVERVARAMAEEGMKEARPAHQTRETMIEAMWPEYLPQARAAIAAMREPTRKMVESASNIDLQPYEGGEYYDFRDAWRAMIDEALK